MSINSQWNRISWTRIYVTVVQWRERFWPTVCQLSCRQSTPAIHRFAEITSHFQIFYFRSTFRIDRRKMLESKSDQQTVWQKNSKILSKLLQFCFLLAFFSSYFFFYLSSFFFANFGFRILFVAVFAGARISRLFDNKIAYKTKHMCCSSAYCLS